MAFLLVFIHHAPVEGLWGLETFKRVGWFGVELFFLISAFLFFHLFERETSRTGRIDPVRFYQRRILRIYPAMAVYVVAMAGLTLTLSAGPDLLLRLLSILTFTGNLTTAFWGYGSAPILSAHLWTLSYEFQVYLVMPVAWWLFFNAERGRFVLFAAGLCLLALAGRVLAVWLDAAHPFIWVLPVLRPESVVAGLLMATAARSVWPIALRMLVGVGCLSMLTVLPEIGSGWVDVALFPLVAVGLYLTVSAVLDSPMLSRMLSVPWLSYLGQISYGLYLYHLLALALCERLVSRTGFPAVSSVPLALALTIAMAVVSYRYVETPFLRLKSQLSR